LVDVIDWGLYEERAFVVTSAYGRSLHELVANGEPLDEHTAVPYMAALADALDYLHRQGFVYQLLDGWATVVGYDARTVLLSWPVFCVPAGSPSVDSKGKSQRVLVRGYAAPEVLSGTAATIEPDADMFALGAIFSSLFAGQQVFFDSRKSGRLPDLRRHTSALTAPFVRLIAALTNSDPRNRPTAVQTKGELARIAAHLGLNPSGVAQ
jgi:serine/threonine protein kinase